MSLCVMSSGTLCTGSPDGIGHVSVCVGRGVSGVCETCAAFCSTKWQCRPQNCSNFPLRGKQEGSFYCKGGGRRKKGTDFFYVLAFCVSVVSLGCVRHMRNYNFALQNGSIGPEVAQIFRCAPHEKGAFHCKGGSARRKKPFFLLTFWCISV